MSYRDPGASYVPPPPPKAKRSPWMFVAIGCGVLVLLVVGGFAFLGYQIVQEVNKNPLDMQKNRVAMRDTPVYPGAELDAKMTQAQYVALKMSGGLIKSDSWVTETWLTSETMDDIQDYYWKILTSRRYKSLPQPAFGDGRAVLYRKDKDGLLVQVQPVPKLGGNAIVLVRFTGMKDDIGEEFEEPQPVTMEAVEVSPGDVKHKEITPTKEKDGTEKGGKSVEGISGHSIGGGTQ